MTRTKLIGSCMPVALCAVLASGCDDATAPGGAEPVAVEFAALMPAPSLGQASAGSLELHGSNGTLVIDEMRFVVAEFELKKLDDDVCDDVAGPDDACEEFDAGPAFVNVPLDGSGVIAVRQPVAPGTYRKLDFEIEDLDDGEEDAPKAQQIAALRAQIRTEFPEWPKDASVLVIGSFTPAGGTAQPFRVYFDAEIEIELDLEPPAVIDGSGSDATFTVHINPQTLFFNGDGTVRNLAALDFSLTGRAIEFEVEIENGMSRVEYRNR